MRMPGNAVQVVVIVDERFSGVVQTGIAGWTLSVRFAHIQGVGMSAGQSSASRR